MLQSIDLISELLNFYDNFQHLECDGLSRVISKVLTDVNVEHQLYLGQVKHKNTIQVIPVHFWIGLQIQNYNYTIDYRCRRWLGDSKEIPHGCFISSSQYPLVIYKGRALDEDTMSSALFNILLIPFPIHNLSSNTQNC